MRITQIHAADQGGGAEAVVLAHHMQLRARGEDARLVVARKHTDAPGVESIPYVRGPKGLRRLARWREALTGHQYVYEPSFRNLLASLPGRTDVVHLHSLHGSGGYAELTPLIGLARRVPTLLTLHDLWWLTGHCAHPQECLRWQIGCGSCPDLARYPAIRRDGTRANFKVKQRVATEAGFHLIAPSAWVRSQVAQSPILRSLPLTIVFNPIDTRTFRPGDRATARASLGVGASERVLLVVAQHLRSPFKGVEPLIGALGALPRPDTRLLLVGHDAELLASKSRLPAIPLEPITDRERMADCYRAADLLLMPSKVETFGLVAAEAMACGTPVVAFPAGALGDVIVDGEGGRVVPQDDMTAFIGAVNGLLDDEDQRSRLSASAAVKAARDFSLEAHTEACLRVYRAHRDTFRRHLQ